METENKEKTEQTEQWDKVRQEADQYKASLVKKSKDLEITKSERDQYKSKVAELEQAVKVSQNKIEIPDLDPIETDIPKIVENNRLLKESLKKHQLKISELEKLATEVQKERMNTAEEQRRSKAMARVRSQITEEFGDKYWNDTYRMANDLISTGVKELPSDEFGAYLLMKECVKEIKAKSEQKESVSVDNGTENLFFKKDDSTEGSLDDIAALMKKNFSKTIRIDEFDGS